jgi:hypothetical protein
MRSKNSMLQRTMTPQTLVLANLSDDQLIAEVHRLAGAERRASAALIRSLIELDTRPHLYLREGCSSLFTYCTRVLHLAEGSTYNRIEVARAARRFPIILEALEEGAVTLTAARLLAPHLTDENHRDVLEAARHQSKSGVEQLVASLRPKPDVRPAIRKLPQVRQPASQPVAEAATATTDPHTPDATTAPAPADTMRPLRAAVTPLSAERYKVELMISGETRDKLRRVQDLLRHAVPDGNLPEVFDRALTSLLRDLEHRRCAATPAPRAAQGAKPGSRYIPAAVRRQVWKRDEGQCAFMGARGRCTETSFLEFHHVDPYAAGGAATVENIELRCAAHNRFEARLSFGADGAEFVRDGEVPWLI